MVQIQMAKGQCRRSFASKARLHCRHHRVSPNTHCPPDERLLTISGRTVPMPTIHQLSEVFDTLPDEPKGPVKRLGPQYERRARPRPQRDNASSDDQPWYARLLPFLASKEEEKPYVNPMSTLRNGDRALVVAVNDSGNTGWVRFARSGFAEAAVM
jgi:tRNA-splicing endonuclease subunit Sen54